MQRLEALVERTRKELLAAVDPVFIHHKIYTKELRDVSGAIYKGVSLVKVGPYTHYEVLFNTDSATFPGEDYFQKFILKDLRGLIRNKKSELSLKEKVLYAINNGDLLIGCDCPAFLYWGYRYILTALGSIHPEYKETRQPKIRNPQEKGIMCKHLAVATMALPFNATSITKEVKEYF